MGHEPATSAGHLREVENEDKLKRALEISLDNRKFEIELLWRRTLVFWGFVAALFVGVAAARERSLKLAIAMGALGVVFSIIWSLVNRGSKSWQESWEIKAQRYFSKLYGEEHLFERALGDQGGVFFLLQPRQYSLSRLLMALSDLTAAFWIGLTVSLGMSEIEGLGLVQAAQVARFKQYGALIFVIGCAGYPPCQD